MLSNTNTHTIPVFLVNGVYFPTQKLRFKAISNLTSRRNSKENSQSPHISKDQTIGSDFTAGPKNVLFQSAFTNKKKSHFEHQNQKA